MKTFQPQNKLNKTKKIFTAKAQGTQRFNTNKLRDLRVLRGEDIFFYSEYFVVKNLCELCVSVANINRGISLW